MTMPEQKPGKSEQNVATPGNFLEALKRKLDIQEFDIDLAADEHNTVAPDWYNEQDNALIQPWTFSGWSFCNPPYAKIEPWVAKAWSESLLGAKIAMLLPASVGSDWWRDWVDQKAYVLLLNGRITFVGHASPYPKDLAVLLYTPMHLTGYQVWDWN